MEINIKTSGFGLGDYTMNASFSMETGGTVSVTPTEPETLDPLDQIQEHLNAIKEVFFSPEYDDKTMGFVIEDYIIAIQEILDAN
jgi:hypothetical protein